MKTNIAIAVVFLILGASLGLIVGFHAGKDYTIPAIELAVKTGKVSPDNVTNSWLATSRTRLFGKYFIFKPSDTNSAALWVCTGQRPYYPVAMLEDDKLTGHPSSFCLSDRFLDSVSVMDNGGDGHFKNLCLQKENMMLMDFDMDGSWDIRLSTSPVSKREVRIGSEWLEWVKKDTKEFVSTKDGLKEVARDKGSYYFVDKN